MNPKLQRLINKHLQEPPSDAYAELLAAISKEFDAMGKLADENRHLKTIQSVAKAGSWEARPDGNIKTNENYWSDELQRMFGVEEIDIPLTYETYLSFMHPDDRQPYEAAVSQALASTSHFDIEFRMTNNKGEQKVLRDIGEVIRDQETGLPVTVLGIAVDITDLRKTESDLWEATRQLRIMMENVEEVFFSVDRVHNKILLMSPGSKKLYGYDSDAFINNSRLWMDIIVEEDKSIVYASELQLAQGERVTNEYRIHHGDGGIRWIEARITPTLDMDGRLVRIDGLTSDITQRKEAELALLVTNEQLKKSNEELDRFVYSVSHDLRAPLASVSGLLSYMMADNADHEFTADLQLMKRSIDKLDVFILDILDYSRNARMEISAGQIDFADLLDDVRNNLKFMSSNKGAVDIRTRVKLTRPFVSDKSRVYIILSNLLSNAIRYHNPNAGDSYAEMAVYTVSGGVMLEVKDNGIGIEPAYQEKIFQMFFRVSDKSAGSGMGLYLVQETVQKLRGTIQLNSYPGEGTLFSIFLPDLRHLKQ
ncbi:PAS domain-containing sensor histidine kinase [Chitinophaga horti]|uniref:histidine kinase n=1 Tax=Chitinophaga horti TaxID=2920382 RepID=A0ABY6J4N5_9BACT|nr:PAS domain-containing sensor histidine kinase [Chitinophaga horti]UYQ94465.1 PAS domain-containing sensor histidine kinase [Chitinophaga horti]